MNNSKINSINSGQSKSVLGKGLASLLPSGSSQPATFSAPTDEKTDTQATNRDRHMGISLVNIDEINANEYQPRREFNEAALMELSLSIKENGLIQPLVVRKNGSHYELIAGERRLRASKLAGLKTVPVVIRRSTDREALELAIVENIQREDLNCVDEGLAYFQLMQEFQLSQEELAKKMGKDRATIANALRILKLSDSILARLKNGSLSRGHAKALLAIEDVAEREKIAQQILENQLSVRQAEKWVQEKKEELSGRVMEGKKEKVKKQNPAEFQRITLLLTRKFMTKVELKGENKGEIRLHFSSKEELNRLIGALLGESK